jgi:hypothetical protein
MSSLIVREHMYVQLQQELLKRTSEIEKHHFIMNELDNTHSLWTSSELLMTYQMLDPFYDLNGCYILNSKL